MVSNNATPYLGAVGSLGLQGTWEHLVGAGELYAAPGSFDPSLAHLYTFRFRFGGTW